MDHLSLYSTALRHHRKSGSMPSNTSTRNGRHGRVGRNSRPMFWLPGQNTTIGMPTPLNGHGRIRRCVDGSLNMPPDFSAGFHAGDTSARSRTTPVANEVRVTYRITGNPKLTFCVFAWGNARWFFGVSGIELVLPSINEVRRPFQSHLSLAPASILRAV